MALSKSMASVDSGHLVLSLGEAWAGVGGERVCKLLTGEEGLPPLGHSCL